MEVPVILDLCYWEHCPGSRVKALAIAGSSSAFPHSFLGVLRSYLVHSLLDYFLCPIIGVELVRLV